MALVLAGCGGCPALEAGTYSVSAVELAGDCGPIDSSTVTISPGELPVFGAASECTGLLDVADDGCFASYDRTCTIGGQSVRFDGYTETTSSTEAVIEFTLTSSGSAGSCRSSYRGTAIRL